MAIYANTDMDLAAESDISALVEVFRLRCYVLSYTVQHHRWTVTVEASEESSNLDSHNRSPSEHLRHILAVVESLSKVERAQWDSCTLRNINVGFECDNTWAFEHSIANEDLARLARAGCTLTVTMYPHAQIS